MTHINLSKSLLIIAGWLCLSLCAAPKALGQTVAPPPPPRPVFTPQPTPKMPPYKSVQSASVPQGWQKYEFGAVPFFSVMLPAKHETTSQTLDLGGTLPGQAFTLMGETDKGAYIAYFVENVPNNSRAHGRGVQAEILRG